MLFLSSYSLQAQQIGFQVKGQRSERIPIEVINNLLVSKVKINDLELNFIIDTGVKIPIIFHSELAVFFRDQPQRDISVRGLGPENAVSALLISNNNVKLGSVKADNVNLVIMPNNNFNVSEYLGMDVHGIIGYDLFKALVVELDYNEKWIRFHNPNKFKVNKKYQTLPLEILGNKPYMNSCIRTENSDSVAVKLMIDTGASFALTMLTESHTEIKIDTPAIQAYLGTGISGDLQGKISRVKEFALGDSIVFEEVITAYPDEKSVRHVQKGTNRNGSVGGEILKRFRVVFDYQGEKIYLKKNSSYTASFDYNKTGMLIKAKGKKHNQFIIDHIDEDSAAAEAGLEVGDQLIQIQQYNPTDLTLGQIYEVFNGTKTGKSIRLKIKRKGSFQRVKLILKSTV